MIFPLSSLRQRANALISICCLAKRKTLWLISLFLLSNGIALILRWSWFVGQESGEVKLQILGLSLVYVMPLVSCFVSAGAGRIVSAEP